jgi:hypothetical protein
LRLLSLTLHLLLEGGKLASHVCKVSLQLLTISLRCTHLRLRCGQLLPQGGHVSHTEAPPDVHREREHKPRREHTDGWTETGEQLEATTRPPCSQRHRRAL